MRARSCRSPISTARWSAARASIRGASRRSCKELQLLLDVEIGPRLHLAVARVHFLDPHRFQEPAALDFLSGDDLEAFRKHRDPIVGYLTLQRAVLFPL